MSTELLSCYFILHANIQQNCCFKAVLSVGRAVDLCNYLPGAQNACHAPPHSSSVLFLLVSPWQPLTSSSPWPFCLWGRLCKWNLAECPHRAWLPPLNAMHLRHMHIVHVSTVRFYHDHCVLTAWVCLSLSIHPLQHVGLFPAITQPERGYCICLFL